MTTTLSINDPPCYDVARRIYDGANPHLVYPGTACHHDPPSHVGPCLGLDSRALGVTVSNDWTEMNFVGECQRSHGLKLAVEIASVLQPRAKDDIDHEVQGGHDSGQFWTRTLEIKRVCTVWCYTLNNDSTHELPCLDPSFDPLAADHSVPMMLSPTFT